MNPCLKLSLMSVVFLSAVTASAGTTDCSNASGTLRYRSFLRDSGIVTPDPAKAEIHWYKDGQELPAEAYDFDWSQDVPLSSKLTNATATRSYVSHVKVDGRSVEVLCENFVALVP